MDKISFGNRVQLARIQLDMSAEKLANIIGVTEMSIRHIESGNRGVSIETLIALCNTLKVTPEFLLLDQIDPSIYNRTHTTHEYVDKLSTKQLDLLGGLLKIVLDDE